MSPVSNRHFYAGHTCAAGNVGVTNKFIENIRLTGIIDSWHFTPQCPIDSASSPEHAGRRGITAGSPITAALGSDKLLTVGATNPGVSLVRDTGTIPRLNNFPCENAHIPAATDAALPALFLLTRSLKNQRQRVLKRLSSRREFMGSSGMAYKIPEGFRG
jgi:hypothetical protein